MQPGAPVHQRTGVRLGPEAGDQGAHEQRLQQGHPRVRRHLEAAHLQQPQPPPLGAGREELVDAELGAVGIARDVGQQVPQQPVHQPGAGALLGVELLGQRLGDVARLVLHGDDVVHLGEGDLQLVERLGPPFVHPWRLAGGADETAAEEVAEGRVVLPVSDQRAQQVGAAQQRRVGRGGAAEGEVVAAAGAGVAAVEVELLGGEADLAGVLVEGLGLLDELAPAPGGGDVDLDDAGVGGDRHAAHPRVAGQRVALEHHRQPHLGGAGLDRGEQLQGRLELLDRRQEDEEVPVALLHCQRGARRLLDVQHGGRAVGHLGQRGGVGGRQRAAGGEGGGLGHERPLGPGDRGQRQPQPGGRVAGHEHERATAGAPARRAPALAVERREDRQHPGDRGAQGGPVDVGHPLLAVALGGQGRVVRGEVALGGGLAGRLPGLVEQPGQRVLVRGDEQLGVDAGASGDADGQVSGGCRGRGAAGLDGRLAPGLVQQRRVVPQRLVVGAPAQLDLPAGQRLAGVPLALAVVAQHPGHGEPVGQRGGQCPLLVAVGGGVPLRVLGAAGGDEGGLAPHRQPHVPLREESVDGLADRGDPAPLVVAEGLGDAWVLGDPGDRVGEGEVDRRRGGGAADRRRRAGVRGRREGDVPLAGEQPGGGVEADPAGAGDEDLGPGVQVGEVLGRAVEAGVADGAEVGGELDEVAGDEAGGQAQVAQQRHEQPGRVAAGADAAAQGLAGGLHARLHPHRVAHRLADGVIERDDEVDDRRALPGRGIDRSGGQARQALLQPLQHGRGQPRRVVALADRIQVGLEVAPGLLGVAEGEGARGVLDEEVEGVDRGHVGDEVDGDVELAHRLREDQPRQPVAERVLLPVDEVLRRRDGQRVRRDRGARVRRRAQPHRVRVDADRLGEAVGRAVLEGYADRHPRQPRGMPGPGRARGRPPTARTAPREPATSVAGPAARAHQGWIGLTRARGWVYRRP